MSAVPTVGLFTLMSTTNKSATFSTDTYAVNDNKNISFLINVANPTTFSCVVELQQSLDNENYNQVPRSIKYITSTDSIIYNIIDTSSVRYYKLKFTIVAGNADLTISARGA